MPSIMSESFPVQLRSNFKLVSEFLNISSLSIFSMWKKFVFSENHFIFATIRLNKIVIFFKKLKIFSLCNVIRNDSNSISLMKMSSSGSKISFVINQEKIIVFNLKKDNQRFFFQKTLEFSSEIKKSISIVSSCFNTEENCVFISFSNGKILVTNLNGKKHLVLKLENPVYNLNSKMELKSNSGFYGVLNKSFLVSYNFRSRKLKNFKYSKIYIIGKDFIVLFNKNTLEIICSCHGKILNHIILSWEIKKILLTEKNEIIIWGDNIFGKLNFGSFSLKLLKIYHFQENPFQGKLVNFKDQFQSEGRPTIFSLIVLMKSDNYLELKSLNERKQFLISFNTIILKNDQINVVKFFGKKNTIILGTNSFPINILNGSCFRFIGSFFDKNRIPVEMIIRDKIILILSISHELFLLDLVSFRLLEKINFPDKISIDFSITKGKHQICFLAIGFKNGAFKIWNIIFQDRKKTCLKLIWARTISENPIVSISMSFDCKTVVLLTKRKKIYLIDFEDNKSNRELEFPEKKISCIKFYPKRKSIIAGTEFGSVILLNIKENNFFKIINGDGFSILDIGFNKNGSLCLATYSDGTVQLFSIYNSLSYSVYRNHSKPVWGCGFSSNERIIIGCSGGQLNILKDISFENAKKQDKKFSKIYFLKTSLKIKRSGENFADIFKRLVFIKNPFMLIDFLEFFFKNNPKWVHFIFSREIKCFDVPMINFIFKSLILWNHSKENQTHIYGIISLIFENLKPEKISNISPSILNGVYKLFKEWVLKIIHLKKQNRMD